MLGACLALQSREVPSSKAQLTAHAAESPASRGAIKATSQDGEETAQKSVAIEPSGATTFAADPKLRILASELGASQYELDSRLPVGERRFSKSEPSWSKQLCSHRESICFYWQSEIDEAKIKAWLDKAEEKWREWIVIDEMPAPLSAMNSKEQPQLRVHFGEGDGQAFPLRKSSIIGERHASFCTVTFDREMDSQLNRCLAGASALAINGAESSGTREAGYQLLRLEQAGVTRSSDDLCRSAAENAQLSFFARERSLSSSREALFLNYWAKQVMHPRAVDLAYQALALSRHVTTVGSARWHNQPDSLDVLRASISTTRTEIAKFYADFALAQWFEFENLRSSDTVWQLKSSELPRRVAASIPLEPLGTAYFKIKLDKKLKAKLAMRAEWEHPVPMKWLLVQLDKDGLPIHRVDVAFLDHARSADRSFVPEAETDSILFIGVNLGAIEVAHQFDPDQEPWESHQLTLYLTEFE